MAIQRINLGTAPSGTGGDTNRSAFTKIDGNFADTTNAASRLVGEATNNVMQVGAFGLGGYTKTVDSTDKSIQLNRFIQVTGKDVYGVAVSVSGSWGVQYGATMDGGFFWRSNKTGVAGAPGVLSDIWYEAWSTKNATKDSNGFLKGASPIVQLYADKIELNDEAKLQNITFEKLGVGDYLVKGSLGFAQEGWYIEMPKDANGNVLVAVVYEQLENNDISVKTYAKKFDEETGDVVANTAKPRDIPATRWIDLRLQSLPQEDTQPLSTDETVTTNAE